MAFRLASTCTDPSLPYFTPPRCDYRCSPHAPVSVLLGPSTLSQLDLESKVVLGQCEKKLSCLEGAVWLIALQGSQLFGNHMMDPSSLLAETD